MPLPDADIRFAKGWLDVTQADALLADLHRSIPWGVHRIKLFGRAIDSPRLSCWIGDPGASYAYSGVRFDPHPWPESLLPVRDRLSAEIGVDLNSVLANLYRDGADYMGWHSDNEAALGPEPVIASLSLGAVRRFALKHRAMPDDRLALELPHGSLLLMRGETQRHYRHSLPRTVKPLGPRINLTFRRVMFSQSPV